MNGDGAFALTPGTVYLVGAGPGAADLLTLRAARLLGQADIVFYDALVSAEILCLAPNAERISVGKRCGRYSTAQRFINRRLVHAARKHRVVVRLKGGDPMLFGRAQEEIAFLHENGIPVAIVPGITAALAASADLAVSLTRRSPPHCRGDACRHAARRGAECFAGVAKGFVRNACGTAANGIGRLRRTGVVLLGEIYWESLLRQAKGAVRRVPAAQEA